MVLKLDLFEISWLSLQMEEIQPKSFVEVWKRDGTVGVISRCRDVNVCRFVLLCAIARCDALICVGVRCCALFISIITIIIIITITIIINIITTIITTIIIITITIITISITITIVTITITITIIITAATTHRLDYVALSEKFRNNDVKAYVETSVDLATVRPDHRLVVCDFTVSQGQSGKWFDRRRCGYDRKAVQSVEACEKFRSMLQQAPSVDWSVDVDSHLALQNAYILHAARQCFASQCKPRKKAWISEQSLQLVRQKRVAVRVWTYLRRKWRWNMLERIVQVWKAVKSGKTPIFILQMHQVRMCAMRSIIANERNMACLGNVLKKSLKDDKNKHVQSVVNAAFVERASGDDRAFWKGVRALRNRGSGGARMIALENGDLAPTPFAGRQRWQRHFAKLLCGEILPSNECVAAARQGGT